jgi:hypothetical protein
LAVITQQAGQLTTLGTQLESLKGVQSDLDKLKDTQKKADETAAKEAGEFEKLYNETKAELETITKANNALERTIEVLRAAPGVAADSGFTVEAIQEASQWVDAETKGEHPTVKVLELAAEKLKKLGLQATPETMAHGGTGSSGAGSRDGADVELAELKELHKKGLYDLTARNEFAVKSKQWRDKHPGQALPKMQ